MALRLRFRFRDASPLAPGQFARFARGRATRGSPEAASKPETGISGPVAAGELERAAQLVSELCSLRNQLEA
eukprot:4939296-Alexandrium_andersonii.AAC.1